MIIGGASIIAYIVGEGLADAGSTNVNLTTEIPNEEEEKCITEKK